MEWSWSGSGMDLPMPAYLDFGPSQKQQGQIPSWNEAVYSTRSHKSVDIPSSMLHPMMKSVFIFRLLTKKEIDCGQSERRSEIGGSTRTGSTSVARAPAAVLRCEGCRVRRPWKFRLLGFSKLVTSDQSVVSWFEIKTHSTLKQWLDFLRWPELRPVFSRSGFWVVLNGNCRSNRFVGRDTAQFGRARPGRISLRRGKNPHLAA